MTPVKIMSDEQSITAQIHTVKADCHNPKHAQAITDLLKAYALDPMGGGEPLLLILLTILYQSSVSAIMLFLL